LMETNSFADKDENPKDENKIYKQAWEAMLSRIDWTVEHLPEGHFPMLGDNETGEWEAYKVPKWTGGFWVGMLWLAYEKTGDNKYLDWAHRWNQAILGFEKEDNHDRGFVYYYSSVYGYRLTGDESYYRSGILAANKLVEMFDRKSGMIPQHQKDKSNIIIDTMVNLPLLWWASVQQNEDTSRREQYRKVAITQAKNTMQDFIRDDGSTWQSVHYDTLTGKIIKKHTHQGFTDSSCWSRGQSWGLYGFIEAYRATGLSEFLESAIKLGDYIINHLPSNGVPWYDYDDPGRFKDTSAGAIAAAAFLNLSGIVTADSDKEKYNEAAYHILNGLIANHLTPFADQNGPTGILRNGCYQIFNNADSETIWGDYYLMEALGKVVFK